MTRHPGSSDRDKRSLSGLLLIDKPPGPTSHDVVDAVRRALGGVRTGHAGTLDPFATGLLALGLGPFTRALRFLSASDKTYEGVVHFGFSTDSDDLTGRPMSPAAPPSFSDPDLADAIQRLEGEFSQAPPVFSARKSSGVPHYRTARRGRPTQGRLATVRVHWDSVERTSGDRVWFRVQVSAGTYVRALARDLGGILACGAHLEALRRVRAGQLELAAAIPYPSGPARIRMESDLCSPGSSGLDTGPSTMCQLSAPALRSAIVVPEDVPLGLPDVTIDHLESSAVRHGSPIHRPELGFGSSGEPWVRLLGPEGRLLALAEVGRAPHPAHDAPAAGLAWVLRPRVVLAPAVLD